MDEKDTAKADVDESTEEPEPIETEEDSKATSEPEPSQDDKYEALRQEEEKRGKPDPEKARQAFIERKSKREQEESFEEDDEERPLTRKEVEEIVARERAKITKDVVETRAIETARGLTQSEAEAQAVLTYWRNRIFPEGMPLAEQMREMRAVVNMDRIESENSELRRALRGNQSVTKNAASTHRDPPASLTPKISAQDAAEYKRAGFSWDGFRKVYKKPVGHPDSKQFLYKDYVTKRTWVGK